MNLTLHVVRKQKKNNPKFCYLRIVPKITNSSNVTNTFINDAIRVLFLVRSVALLIISLEIHFMG